MNTVTVFRHYCWRFVVWRFGHENVSSADTCTRIAFVGSIDINVHKVLVNCLWEACPGTVRFD